MSSKVFVPRVRAKGGAATRQSCIQRKRKRIMLRPSPSTFGTINSLMTIQSTVHTRLNWLLSKFNPLMFESTEPKEMLIQAVQYGRDCQELDELDEKLHDAQLKREELEMDAVQRKTLEPLLVNLVQCQSRILELKGEGEYNPVNIVKLSRLKERVMKQMEENEDLERQIAILDKRIDLMQRKRSYVAEPSPRKNNVMSHLSVADRLEHVRGHAIHAV